MSASLARFPLGEKTFSLFSENSRKYVYLAKSISYYL
jgi:hypothetical protein